MCDTYRNTDLKLHTQLPIGASSCDSAPCSCDSTPASTTATAGHNIVNDENAAVTRETNQHPTCVSSCDTVSDSQSAHCTLRIMTCAASIRGGTPQSEAAGNELGCRRLHLAHHDLRRNNEGSTLLNHACWPEGRQVPAPNTDGCILHAAQRSNACAHSRDPRPQQSQHNSHSPGRPCQPWPPTGLVETSCPAGCSP